MTMTTAWSRTERGWSRCHPRTGVPFEGAPAFADLPAASRSATTDVTLSDRVQAARAAIGLSVRKGIAIGGVVVTTPEDARITVEPGTGKEAAESVRGV